MENGLNSKAGLEERPRITRIGRLIRNGSADPCKFVRFMAAGHCLMPDLGLAITSVSESIPLIVLKPLTGGLTMRDLAEPEALFRAGFPLRSTMRPSLKGLVTDLDS